VKSKVILPILVLITAVGIAAVLMVTRQPLRPAQPQPAPTAVRVVEVTPGAVRLSVHAQGTVSPRTETDLVPEISGNVVWMSPNLVSGGYFEAGEALLRVDDRDYAAALRRAEAALSRAEAENEHAQFEYQRAEDLHTRQLISRAELEGALRTSRVAESSVKDARAALDTAQRDLARTTLQAPFAGFVRSKQVDVGQFVSRGAAIASVYASDFLEVRLPIADQQLAYLNVPLDQRGEIDEALAPSVKLSAVFAGRKQTWEGTLARTEAEIDPNSRMVYAIARVRSDGQDAAPPPVGLFVQAEIEGIAAEDVVVLPRSALRDGDRVLIVDSENRLYFREVGVLRVYRDDVYIGSGLGAGDRVVVSPIQTVVNGMRVVPLLPEAEIVEEG
jgi:RND family efflux transporter MFP subunit